MIDVEKTMDKVISRKLQPFQIVSLPFTAPSDGVLRVLINPSSASPAYYVINTNETTGIGYLRVNAFQGYVGMNDFNVYKDEYLYLASSGGVGGALVCFAPYSN